ncbi:MAG: glycosyltransferase family 4 protein [Acidobacteriaceae bacterium]
MRIAQIAPLWIPIPPRTYGGIELMVFNLVEELKKRGHEIVLYASGDSHAGVETKSVVEQALWLQKQVRNPHAAIIRMLNQIRQDVGAYDLIHNHFNFFMFPLANEPKAPPILTTIHNPIDQSLAETIKQFPNLHFCVLSEDERKSAEEFGIATDGVVPNGIEIEKYTFNPKMGDYLLYLGRLNREKGIATALSVAKKSNTKIVVAGNIVGAEEWTYFMHEVQPNLNEENVKFVGQVDFAEKIKLLSNAKALLFPIDRREPFGLVMIEAMACGTPVIAFGKGSVPEIVENGKNGFVVNTEDEMVQMVDKIGFINREHCRKAVEEKYTIKHMTDKYEEIYQKILKKNKNFSSIERSLSSSKA